MKVILVLIMVLASFQNKAFSKDIHGVGDRFIKVTTMDRGNLVQFELCQILKPYSCVQLGNRKVYSRKELEKLRQSEEKDIVLATLAGLGVGVVGFYGGAFAGGFIVASSAGIASVGIAGGVTAGTGLATVLAINVDVLNPMEQYRQIRMLNEDVMADQTVNIDRSIDDIAHTLQAILNNLDN
jgi:hypothetical protein